GRARAGPAAAPVIDPHYGAEPEHSRRSLEGLRVARDIITPPALRRFVLAERLPGPDKLSDADLFAYGCANAKTDYHPVGTCRMGPATDLMSVVTPDLALIGLAALRIADASVMPPVPSSNTNAPIKVAEARDTAQRGMGVDWPVARELIRRSLRHARTVPGADLACGAGTDQLAPGADVTLAQVEAAYREQIGVVEAEGGRVILMASR